MYLKAFFITFAVVLSPKILDILVNIVPATIIPWDLIFMFNFFIIIAYLFLCIDLLVVSSILPLKHSGYKKLDAFIFNFKLATFINLGSLAGFVVWKFITQAQGRSSLFDNILIFIGLGKRVSVNYIFEFHQAISTPLFMILLFLAIYLLFFVTSYNRLKRAR